MNNNDSIYTSLCVVFAVLIVVGNLIYQKFVSLDLGIYTFELSVGAILYPLTFLITDVITEIYNKEKARFCVKLALSVNILVVTIIWLMDKLNATGWSKINDETFHFVFGQYWVAFMSSLIACYIAQYVDINVYLWIRRATNGRYLWLRSNLSTCISLFIDTCIVISLLSIAKIIPIEQAQKLIINSYSWKLFFTLSSTPLFYFLIWLINLVNIR